MIHSSQYILDNILNYATSCKQQNLEQLPVQDKETFEKIKVVQKEHYEFFKKQSEYLQRAFYVENELKTNQVHDQVKRLLQIPQYEQRSPEWFAQRKGKLTSSDIDTVLGNNKYGVPDDVLFKKHGIAKPFTGNDATRHGQKYEDEAIRIYCERYNKKTFSFGLLPHPQIDFLAGSPDDITYDGIVVEVKCPLRRKIIPNEIPKHYRAQLNMNMEICGLDHGVFIEYKPKEVFGEEEFNVVHIQRDPNWMQTVFPIIHEFWEKVRSYENKIDTHPKYENYLKKANPDLKKLNDGSVNCMCDPSGFVYSSSDDDESLCDDAP